MHTLEQKLMCALYGTKFELFLVKRWDIRIPECMTSICGYFSIATHIKSFRQFVSSVPLAMLHGQAGCHGDAGIPPRGLHPHVVHSFTSRSTVSGQV